MDTSYLYVSQTVTLVLFLISELLGSSKCKYNGVFQFVFSNMCCVGSGKFTVDVGVEEIDVDNKFIYVINSDSPEISKKIAKLVEKGISLTRDTSPLKCVVIE